MPSAGTPCWSTSGSGASTPRCITPSRSRSSWWRERSDTGRRSFRRPAGSPRGAGSPRPSPRGGPRAAVGRPPPRALLLSPVKVPYSYLDRQFDADETEAILGELRALVRTGEFTIGPPGLAFQRRLGAPTR